MQNKFQKCVVLGLALAGLGIESVHAFPLPSPAEQKAHATQEWSLERAPRFNLDFLAVDFTAIVALSNCSGSLVRYETSLPTDPAMVLTNGHCLEGSVPFLPGFPAPGEVKVDVAVRRQMKLLNPDATTRGTINADRIIYAAMTGTDMTLYRLNETFEQIEKRLGVQPLVLSSKRPSAGTPITIASGYWKRLYSCTIDKFIHKMREDKWTFWDSIRYTQPGCETIGGTSGSPIINQETREVVGVNNTGNEDGDECTMNNPCEIDENGNVTVVKKASYGQQTYWLYSCLDSSNRLNLKKAGCQLHGGSL